MIRTTGHGYLVTDQPPLYVPTAAEVTAWYEEQRLSGIPQRAPWQSDDQWELYLMGWREGSGRLL